MTLTPEKQEGYASDYWKVEGKEMTAHIERRPWYCDRGRFKVLIEARGVFELSFDGQDGFPRYYFGWSRMLGELEDFMEIRGQLKDPPTDAQHEPTNQEKRLRVAHVTTFPAGYLPLDCPVCARRRLEYGTNDDGVATYIECEKCGANSEDETLDVREGK